MVAIQVFKKDFDSSENNSSDARSNKLLGTFIEKGSLSAHGNAGQFILKLKPMILSLEWNGEVYPQIYIKEIEIK